jgi:hypothetical protein
LAQSLKLQGVCMPKAMKVAGGYAVKRKARIWHECHDCGHYIEPGEDYYQLTLDNFRSFSGWITRHICESCWRGRELQV